MSGFDDYRDLCEERDQLRAELEAAKQDAAKCAAAHINAVSACNENAHLLTKASAELAELRARLAAAESELASVKKGGAEFIHPVEELIGGPNACGICGRNDGLHYAHE